MCLSARHLDILRRLNEQDFARGRASQETHGRFIDLFERCASCPHFDNGAFGDVPSDCRQAFLRLFISMKRDAENYLLSKRFEAQAREARSVCARTPVPTPPSLPMAAVPAMSTPAPLSLAISQAAAQSRKKKRRRAHKRADR